MAAVSPTGSLRDSPQWCGICWDVKPPQDMQELACRHVFCTQCLAACMGALCPEPMCCTTRTTDVVVDEGLDECPVNIAFGGKMPSILDLEEKMRCEARRGRFLCSNVARVALQDCRHRICFDCLAQRVQYANKQNEVPNCAHPRCANKLSSSEVLRIAEKFPNMEAECKQVLANMPPENEEADKNPNDLIISCSVWARPHTTRRLTIPKNCSVGDMLNGILQMQRLVRNRSTSSFGIYVMKGKECDQRKYELVDLKAVGKKTVENMGWSEKAHFVVDLDNVLAKRR